MALATLFFLFCLMLLFSQRSSNDFLYILFLGAFWHIVAIGHYLSVHRRYLMLSTLKVVPPLLFLMALVYSIYYEFYVPIFDLQAASLGVFVLFLFFSIMINKGERVCVIDFEACRSYFYKYRRLFFYQLPADLLSDISRFAMPLLIPVFYGNHAAGLYMIASKLLFFSVDASCDKFGSCVSTGGDCCISSERTVFSDFSECIVVVVCGDDVVCCCELLFGQACHAILVFGSME